MSRRHNNNRRNNNWQERQNARPEAAGTDVVIHESRIANPRKPRWTKWRASPEQINDIATEIFGGPYYRHQPG